MYYINIANFISQSIMNKSISINNFHNTIDIKLMSITETRLKPNDSYLNIPDRYDILRQDRIGKQGGGITLIFHKSLSVTQKKLISETEDEVMWLTIETIAKSFSLLIIYAPPKSTFSLFKCAVLCHLRLDHSFKPQDKNKYFKTNG